MLTLLILTSVALVLCLVAPRLLTSGTWRVRRPLVALRLWFVALAVGVASVVGIIVELVRATLRLTPFADMPGVAIGSSVVIAMVAWIALALLGGVLALVSEHAERRHAAGRPSRRALELLADAAVPLADLDPVAADVVGEGRRGERVLVVDDTGPAAVALPGRRGGVLVARRLVARLDTAALAAVVAHERSHLRRRHHLLVGIAQLHEDCLPGSPAGRELRRATRLLVELVADDDAARKVGAGAVARAIKAACVVDGHTPEEGAAGLLRARRLARAPGSRPSRDRVTRGPVEKFPQNP